MALNVYYSVSPFGTGNIRTGTPTCTISSGVMTINTAQTGNIGVGCRITYDTDSICYISAVNSSTSFDVVTALGVAAGDEGSPVNVDSVAHEYASLSAAEAGFTDADHINDTDLTNADVVANICCYYDHDDFTFDTTLVTIDGAVVDATRFINIYTPTGGTESINSQRHNGKLSTSKYMLSFTDIQGIVIRDNYINITGIQLQETWVSVNNKYLISFGGIVGSNEINFDSMLLRQTNPASGNTSGIVNLDTDVCANFQNSVIYDFSDEAIVVTGTINFLNCTVANNSTSGIRTLGGAVSVINCAVFNNGTVDFDDDGSAFTIDHCASDDGDGTNAVTITQSASDYAALVTDAPAGDFSVTDASSELYNAGTNTGAPSYDIIGTARPQNTTTDIGAFELISGEPPAYTSTEIIFYT